MTATITPPPDAVKLARRDPGQRMEDYRKALEFYLALPGELISRIVFVENSATDLGPLQEIAAGFAQPRVEFISFHGLDFPPNYGRAYGEFKILDHAFSQSDSCLARLDGGQRIWKATGRLRLTNIAAMIKRAPAKCDMYCDLRNRNGHWMDMRFYSFTVRGYQTILKGIAEQIREDQYGGLAAETLIYPLIHRHVASGAVAPRFNTQPRIAGVSGFENRDYSEGLKNNVKTYSRMVLRKVAPGVWF
jgi:hypothetical protein